MTEDGILMKYQVKYLRASAFIKRSGWLIIIVAVILIVTADEDEYDRIG